jgi:hypothetical protein
MNLWRVGVDEATGSVLGQPQPVTTPSPYSGYLSIARDGRRIAYANVMNAQNLFKIGFDSSREATAGQPTAITHGTRATTFPELARRTAPVWTEAVRARAGYCRGRTCTCMKLSSALIDRISITVLVCGLRTPADGVAARQYWRLSSNVDAAGSPP